MDPAMVVPILTLAANVGFSVVVCWYLLAKGIPEMQQRFSADLKAQRDDNYTVWERERLANERERQVAMANMERMLAIVSRDEVELMKRTAEETHSVYVLLQDFVRASLPVGGRK